MRIQEFLADTHLSLSAEQLMPHLYWHADDRAIHHLFRVAASLDSMIVGESQILGQLKDAFGCSLSHKTSGVILNKIVKKAISVAKRVRTDTRIAAMAVTLPVFLAHVDFHIAPHQPLSLHLQKRVTKVRARSSSHAAWIYHPDPCSAVGSQPLLASRLLLPQTCQ